MRAYRVGMSFEHLFAGVPVGDIDAAVAWYERLFDRPPDLVPTRARPPGA
jgi:hypothetical protein